MLEPSEKNIAANIANIINSMLLFWPLRSFSIVLLDFYAF